MARSTNEVLGIPELLEAILLELPMRDLLLAQNFDKTFRDAIKSSKHIQKALFFEPSNRITSPDEPPVLNPLLTLIFVRGRFTAHPHHKDWSDARKYTPGQHIDLQDYASALGALHGHINRNSAQSWQEMLVSDPPCAIYQTDQCPCHDRRFKAITIGQLVGEIWDCRLP